MISVTYNLMIFNYLYLKIQSHVTYQAKKNKKLYYSVISHYLFCPDNTKLSDIYN